MAKSESLTARRVRGVFLALAVCSCVWLLSACGGSNEGPPSGDAAVNTAVDTTAADTTELDTTAVGTTEVVGEAEEDPVSSGDPDLDAIWAVFSETMLEEEKDVSSCTFAGTLIAERKVGFEADGYTYLYAQPGTRLYECTNGVLNATRCAALVNGEARSFPREGPDGTLDSISASLCSELGSDVFDPS